MAHKYFNAIVDQKYCVKTVTATRSDNIVYLDNTSHQLPIQNLHLENLDQEIFTLKDSSIPSNLVFTLKAI